MAPNTKADRIRQASLWLAWGGILALVTLALVSMRDGASEAHEAHIALLYLLVVLGGSASGGRPLGYSLACGSFLLIDYYLQTPYDTLAVHKPHDWLVLVAFVTTATVANQLLGRANAEARAARRHAEEIDRLSAERVRLVEEAEHAGALREADRLKDALLASVSHDLRTPLTTIKALAHDIAAGGEERATVIEQEVDRLNHMVVHLLDLSRLNAGAMSFAAEINTAEDLIGAAIQEAAGALNGREVRTAIAWSEPVAVGRFDFVQSLRVLVNLIENAHKYSPPGDPIDLAVEGAGATLSISVADRGPGVPPAEREKIFEPFYRSPRASPDAGGAGLGLAISRRLAEGQGGRLLFTPRPGGGSLFIFELPGVKVTEGSAGV